MRSCTTHACSLKLLHEALTTNVLGLRLCQRSDTCSSRMISRASWSSNASRADSALSPWKFAMQSEFKNNALVVRSCFSLSLCGCVCVCGRYPSIFLSFSLTHSRTLCACVCCVGAMSFSLTQSLTHSLSPSLHV